MVHDAFLHFEIEHEGLLTFFQNSHQVFNFCTLDRKQVVDNESPRFFVPPHRQVGPFGSRVQQVNDLLVVNFQVRGSKISNNIYLKKDNTRDCLTDYLMTK